MRSSALAAQLVSFQIATARRVAPDAWKRRDLKRAEALSLEAALQGTTLLLDNGALQWLRSQKVSKLMMLKRSSVAQRD